ASAARNSRGPRKRVARDVLIRDARHVRLALPATPTAEPRSHRAQMPMKSCSTCTRRSVLQGIGAAAAELAILPGCMTMGSSLPTAKSSSCGGGLCIDLSDAANSDLASPGGAMLIDMASDTVMVIRTSATDVVALSAICTHAGCSMNFDAASERL